MISRFVPDSGNLIWLDFDPVVGHKQEGHRPAVVLSPFPYHNLTGMCLCLPCTTQRKGYNFETGLSGDHESLALAGQVTCVDWRNRKATKKAK